MERSHSRTTLLLSIFFMLVSSAATAATARDTISPTNPLSDNETLVCASKAFALGFFTPSGTDNSYIGLWYNQISEPDGHTILWVANRQNPVVGGSAGALLSVTPDGRLTITSSNKTVVWASPNSTVILTSAVAQLLDNGNLVVKKDGDNSGSSYGWQGFNYLTDTLIPGMRIGLDRTTGNNRTLVAWASASDPSPATYYLFMDVEGDPEIYFYQASTPIWRTGPWDGMHLSGIPDMGTYRDISFGFANDASEVTYFYSISNQTLVTRLFVNSTGVVQVAFWLWETNQWKYSWTAPEDTCDHFGYCGPSGLCDLIASPTCSCLTNGFSPKNQANWNLRDGHDGCKRNNALDCRNGTDVFNTVSNVKLPQSENCTVDMSLNLAQCEQLCRQNCSCIAYASANVSNGGSGCVIWVGDRLFDTRNYFGNGQDLYVRVAAADVVSRKSRTSTSTSKWVAIISGPLFGAVLLACVGIFIWKRKKRKIDVNNYFRDKSNEVYGVNGLDLPLVDFGTIATATDSFSSENKLGEGGFGPVYKCKLGGDQEVAVKRLSKTSQQGVDEFKNEVMLIAKLQHRNLVRLLGYCIHGDERMLIYDYMPNKSLDTFLFGQKEGISLDWRTRYRITVGITRGLLYLHHDSRLRIIHRDLKASNILLDKDMNPKISDFGLARIFRGDEADLNTRKVVGTYGYMSPEYALEGTFSVKSDVFSFGVLVLEIVSGKKNRGVYTFSPHLNLLAHAWSLWNEGNILQLAHDSMGSFPRNEVLKCIKIGLLCVQERPEDRPLMSSVIEMLGSDVASLPEPNPPGFVSRFGPSEADPFAGNQVPCTLNGLTITEVDGR